MLSFDTIQGYLAIATPAIAWFSTVALIVAVALLIARAGRRRGARTITTVDNAQARRDRRIFVAALTAGAIVYAALIAGSFTGLTGWAVSTLRWSGWQQYLVPLSLDGLGTAAGFLAFRAVQTRTSPYWCYGMVWGATTASAVINFTQGGKHGGTAAFYMAFLSVAVMVMFHLFLEQFQAGAEYVGKKYPRFGIRWLTYTWPTLLDFLCWVNHPPAAGTEPTVHNAVAHREAYRNRKQEAAHAAALVSARRAAELAEAEAAPEPEVAPEPEPAVGAEAQPEAPPAPNRKPVTARNRKSPTGNPATAKAVERARQRFPHETQEQIAARVKVSVRTVRNYWDQPSNVTPIHKEAVQ